MNSRTWIIIHAYCSRSEQRRKRRKGGVVDHLAWRWCWLAGEDNPNLAVETAVELAAWVGWSGCSWKRKKKKYAERRGRRREKVATVVTERRCLGGELWWKWWFPYRWWWWRWPKATVERKGRERIRCRKREKQRGWLVFCQLWTRFSLPWGHEIHLYL